MLAAEAKRSWSKAHRLLKAESVQLARPVEARPSTRAEGLPPDAAPAEMDAEAALAAPPHTNGSAVPAGSQVPPLEIPAAPANSGEGGRRPRRMRPRQARRWTSYRERARAMVAQARAEADGIREAAREEGFRAGFQQGEEAGRRQAGDEVARRLQALVTQMQRAAEEAEGRRDRALRQSGEDTVKLALAVAEKVVRRQIADGPAVTAAVLESVLKDLPVGLAGRVVARLNPGEHRLLAGSEGLLARVAGPVQVELVADPSVEPGGCHVETEMGSIDAGLETRLAGVSRALLDVMRRGT